MNTPKYYIGQKVMLGDKELTIAYVGWYSTPGGYYYDTHEVSGHINESELHRPPAKLEFGYCAVGDVVVDRGGYEREILDVRENVFIPTITVPGLTYKATTAVSFYEARVNGWEIKEEDSSEEKIEEAKRLLSNLQEYKDYMVGELNGVKYKISLLEE